jgi:hypothetical protein
MVGFVTASAGIAAVVDDRLLYVAGLSEGQLVVLGIVLAAVGLGVFFLSRSIEVSRTYAGRDNGVIVSTVVLVLGAWCIVGFPLFFVAVFASSSTYTGLRDVAGHQGLVARESSSWDGEPTTTVFQGDGFLFVALPITLPSADGGYQPLAAGKYTLAERDGSLVLSYPQSRHSDYYGAAVVLP